MTRCRHCGNEVSVLIRKSNCLVNYCQEEVKTGEGGTDNAICPTHQRELPQKVNNLAEKIEKQLAETKRNQSQIYELLVDIDNLEKKVKDKLTSWTQLIKHKKYE